MRSVPILPCPVSPAHISASCSPNSPDHGKRPASPRTDVVQVFPNPEAVLRLATAVLAEMHDEWIAFPRRYLSEESMATVYATVDTEALPGTTEG